MTKVISFVNGAIDEFKRVQWPTKQETMRLTAYVIGVSLGVALFVMVLDYLFKQLLGVILVR